MPRAARSTVQLCGAAQNPAERASLRCVLNQGHEGPHEGFDKQGARVKFEVIAPPAGSAR